MHTKGSTARSLFCWRLLSFFVICLLSISSGSKIATCDMFGFFFTPFFLSHEFILTTVSSARTKVDLLQKKTKKKLTNNVGIGIGRLIPVKPNECRINESKHFQKAVYFGILGSLRISIANVYFKINFHASRNFSETFIFAIISFFSSLFMSLVDSYQAWFGGTVEWFDKCMRVGYSRPFKHCEIPN